MIGSFFIYRASQNSPKAPPDPPKVFPRAPQTTLTHGTPLPHALSQSSSRPPQSAPQSIPDHLDLPWVQKQSFPELSQSSSRPSQSAPQSTPDHLDLPRVQKQLFWELFFNNMRFRRGETVVWDNPAIPGYSPDSPDSPDRVSSAAARDPSSTRAGGQDDGS